MELITKKAAQRVAHVIHHLPQIELQMFILPLARYLGLPITEEKLANLTMAELIMLFTNEEKQQLNLDIETIKWIGQCLQGKNDPNIPTLDSPIEGNLSGSALQVAVASQSGEMIDGHFGSCPRFLVYQVGRDILRLTEIRSTSLADEKVDKNAARTQLIQDCPVLYVHSIGGPAAAKVVHAGIHPVKFSQGGPAREALLRLQIALQSPPPWLAKILDVPRPVMRYSCEELME